MLAAGKVSVLRQALRDKKGIKHVAAGAFVAPFLGVTLSMATVAYTQTLMSLMSVLVIPVVWVFYKQRTSLQGILGATVAIIGVAVLFIT